MAAAVASEALASKCTPSSLEDPFGVRQYVHEMRDGRTLVAADVGDARLQQRLGDGEDSLALELLAGPQAQRLHFTGK